MPLDFNNCPIDTFVPSLNLLFGPAIKVVSLKSSNAVGVVVPEATIPSRRLAIISTPFFLSTLPSGPAVAAVTISNWFKNAVPPVPELRPTCNVLLASIVEAVRDALFFATLEAP